MDQFEQQQPAPARRFGRFSLATVFVLMTVVAILITVGIERKKEDITAYIYISQSAEEENWPADIGVKMDDAEYLRFRATQAELLRSQPLLVRMLRDPAVGKLPLIQGQSDPVGWLQSELRCDFPGDGELLRVRLRCRDAAQGVKILDAVVDAYFRECVEKRIAERSMVHEKLKRLYEEQQQIQIRELREIDSLRAALKGEETPELHVREARVQVHAEILRDMQLDLHKLWLQKHIPNRVQRIEQAMSKSFR